MLKGQRRTPEEFVRIVSALHPELDFSMAEYKNARSLVRFKCAEHGEQEIQANGLLHGRGCPVCGRHAGRANAYEAISAANKSRASALTPEEKAEMAARARAGRTADSFKKMSESQRARQAAVPEEERKARMHNAVEETKKRWAAVPPDERKERMAAVRAAKQQTGNQ